MLYSARKDLKILTWLLSSISVMAVDFAVRMRRGVCVSSLQHSGSKTCIETLSKRPNNNASQSRCTWRRVPLNGRSYCRAHDRLRILAGVVRRVAQMM